jgi:hypothetical protein
MTTEDLDPSEDPGPFVCPGCYAVGEEPCLPGCIDAEIAAAASSREEAYWCDDEDDDEDWEWRS